MFTRLRLINFKAWKDTGSMALKWAPKLAGSRSPMTSTPNR